jgi:hypothetical protein
VVARQPIILSTPAKLWIEASGGVKQVGGMSFYHALSAKGSIELTLASPISLDMNNACPS